MRDRRVETTPNGMLTGPHRCPVAGSGGLIRSLLPQRSGVFLEDVTVLESTLENRAAMADRIGKMEQDQAAFTASVRALVEQLGDAFDAGQAVAVNDGLSDRLAKAIHDRKARSQCLEEMESVVKDIAKVETSLVELPRRRRRDVQGIRGGLPQGGGREPEKGGAPDYGFARNYPTAKPSWWSR